MGAIFKKTKSNEGADVPVNERSNIPIAVTKRFCELSERGE